MSTNTALQEILPHDPSERQRTASNPVVSAWVNASAGSGKTKVLTDRMLRLLLPRENGEPGTQPEKILALTFTKAGANEMAVRLSRRLSEWAIMDDATLSANMDKELLGRMPTANELTEARKLFAKVVDAPGGLKILTIHSFCQSILGRFPIEAGLTPDFSVLEEAEANNLRSKALQSVLRQTVHESNTPLSYALENLATHLNEEQIEALITTCSTERQQLYSLLAANFSVDGLYTNICTLLGVNPAQSLESLDQEFHARACEIDLVGLCTALSASKSKADIEKGPIFAAYWHNPKERQNLYEAYRAIFLTKDNNVRKTIVTSTVLKSRPDIMEQLYKEAEAILFYESKRKASFSAILTRDAILFSLEVLQRYEDYKNLLGALDFNDLILRTRDLLKGQTGNTQWYDSAAWVLYKLDNGIDHILVDEAQDTNPEQWEIIQLLSQEFFSGLNAHEQTRTVFVVGDEKQSIFSFQRAAPDKFRGMFQWFDQKIGEAGQNFIPVPINTSFRSIQIILDTVDAVFKDKNVQRHLGDIYLNHFAFRSGQAGLVELWPIYRPTDDENEIDVDGWDIPDSVKETRSGANIMANKIGDTIKSWLDKKEILESYARPIEAGDILILVKSRNAFVPQLVRALKIRGIPVSGVDRMVLSEQLVVEDLCAAAKFALLPEDDLTLATLLKSPFIGYSEDRLFQMAHGRHKGESLWSSVKKSGDSVTVEYLNQLIERSGQSRPYEFFGYILQTSCPAHEKNGLYSIKRRLGEDAVDPLDEFLNLCLNFEHKHTPSLQLFLQWHEKGKSEIKRQLEDSSNAVRIMTVHGSKGLQAPIVFLPDTVRTASSPKSERVLWPHKTGLSVPFVISSKTDAPEAVQKAIQSIEEKEDEEYRRLLYVAMTRAEERLYIGGYSGKRKPSEDGSTVYWYEDIKRAFSILPDIKEIPSGISVDGKDLPILRLEVKRTAPPDKAAQKAKSEHAKKPVLPDLYMLPPAAEPFPPRPLVPSRPSQPEPASTSPLETKDIYRFMRGNITHKLLQALPELEREKWKDAALKFVAQPAFLLPSDIQASIVTEVLTILEKSDFAPIFGPGSVAEVPVTGLLKSGRLISGQIDRIFVTDTEVMIIDYKTNRPPPKMPEDIPLLYRGQMAAYKEALSQIYPARNIRTALLWTDGPRLMEISAD